MAAWSTSPSVVDPASSTVESHAAAVVQLRQLSQVEARKTIEPQIPLSIRCRIPEYGRVLWQTSSSKQALTVKDESAMERSVKSNYRWHVRHSVQAAVHRNVMHPNVTLWSNAQKACLSALFPNNRQWWTEATHPMFTLAAEQVIDANAAEPTTNTTVTVLMADLKSGRSAYWTSTVDLSALGECVAAILPGPALYRMNAPREAAPSTSPEVAPSTSTPLELYLGTVGTYLEPRANPVGSDLYVHLLDGEKMWLFAHPDEAEEFASIMAEEEDTGPGKRVSKKRKAAGTLPGSVVARRDGTRTRKMMMQGIEAVHQKVGDVVFVPGGVHYAVKNLTDTVALGAIHRHSWSIMITSPPEQQRTAASTTEEWAALQTNTASALAHQAAAVKAAESNQ